MAATKPMCKQCGERPVFSKELCSGCYGRQWREARKAARVANETPAIEGEVIDGVAESTALIVAPSTHLTAINPVEMQAAQGDMVVWLEQKLTVLEHDIVEANAALNEARRNGWATAALTSARNRAVDDETFYNKVLGAVEAGHTIIPDFPIDVFAVRTSSEDKSDRHTWTGYIDPKTNWLSKPVGADYSPAGAGEYRNPEPQVRTWHEYVRKNAKGEEYHPFTIHRTGRPVGPIMFPSITARSPIMRATANAMDEKVFDRIGVCHPIAAGAASTQQIRTNTGRAGDPLVIGQVVHKPVGAKQKVVSFIIAWYLNLNEL